MTPGQSPLDAGPAQAGAPPMLEGHRKTLDDAKDPPYHAYRSIQGAIMIRRTAPKLLRHSGQIAAVMALNSGSLEQDAQPG
jgi:hypothetical protein